MDVITLDNWTKDECKYVVGIAIGVDRGLSFEEAYEKYKKHLTNKEKDEVKEKYEIAYRVICKIIDLDKEGIFELKLDERVPEPLFSVLKELFYNFSITNGIDVKQNNEKKIVSKINISEYNEFKNNADKIRKELETDNYNINYVYKVPNDFNKGLDFFSVLDDFRESKGLSPKQVYTNSYIKPNTYSDWLNLNRIPKIEQVLKLCIGMKLNYKESCILLKSANCEFGGTDERVRAMEYFIYKGIYNVDDIDESLVAMHLEPLFQPGLYDKKYERAK